MERNQTLDALRGFALFGILVVNIQGFKFPLVATEPIHIYFPGTANTLARYLIDVLFSGKFISIFSFLFGFGLALQTSRAESTGASTRLFLIRRMAVLFVLGVLHGIFLWAGDILTLYALLGLLSVLLIHRSAEFLSKLAATLLALMLLLAAAAFLTTHFLPPPENFSVADVFSPASEWKATADAWIECYTSNSLHWITLSRIEEWKYMWSAGFLYASPSILAYHLLGMVCGKAGLAHITGTLFPRLRRHVIPALAAGIALSAVSSAIQHGWLPPTWTWWSAAWAADIAGTFLLVFAYLIGAAAVFSSGFLPRVTAWLAGLGRLSLTNYLFQSLAANVIFMGWGLGFYGRVSATAGLAIAVFLFALQIILSHLWLRHHSTGPIEFLWRKLSYPSR